MVVAAPPSAATEYAEAVIGGSAPAGRLVRLACERHLRDLEEGEARGLRWDGDAAERAIGFIELLPQSKGEWAQQPLTLMDWQRFVVGSIFGWKRADGQRRYRYAYIEVPRKAGKTTMAAGVGLYMLDFDDEPGAEIYFAATKRDQARLAWEEAARMVRQSPYLREQITIIDSRANMHITATASKAEALGADTDSTDGLNAHANVIDELHAHKTRGLWDVLEEAMAARRQPLTFAITTAGWDRNSICWEQHDYGAKVLDRVVADDAYFAYIATIDEGDDWRTEVAWAKANPSLGITVKFDYLREKAARAQETPGLQNSFQRKHLNIWTEQADRWLDMGVWDRGAAPVNVESLRGRRCFAGLDLASTRDVTALVLLFPETDGTYAVLCLFWIPEDGVRERSRRDRVPYEDWVRDGLVEATPGNVTDYDVIRRRIQELAAMFDIEEIAYDRWNSSQLVTQLMDDGATMVPFGQGFYSMAAPTKEIDRLALLGALRHGGDPVLRWMAANVAVAEDPAGNLKIDKARSTEKVDGMVALAMALGRATVHQEEPPSPPAPKFYSFGGDNA